MTTNELRVLEIIWAWGGEASVDTIAREAGISIDYVQLICESLGRESCIDFWHSKLCRIKGKGKLVIAERKAQNPQKIVVPEKTNKFGLGKNKRGRLMLSY